eukprot:scaffold18570_cov89-Cylindrotheca_fusiformis.AAC.2
MENGPLHVFHVRVDVGMAAAVFFLTSMAPAHIFDASLKLRRIDGKESEPVMSSSKPLKDEVSISDNETADVTEEETHVPRTGC